MDIELKFAHYGEERETNATKDDMIIYEKLVSLLPEDDFRMVRKSDQYLTLMLGVWDIARFKWTKRAKWIKLPIIDVGSKKRYLESVEDVVQHKDDLIASYEYAKKNQ